MGSQPMATHLLLKISFVLCIIHMDCKVRQSIFEYYREKENLSSALLFRGQSGVGKFETARAIALFYTDDFHVHVLKTKVTVDTIRDINQTAVQGTLSNERKFYIIDTSSVLAGAYNALLKILEEPPIHVHFILLYSGGSNLLSTIISRCRVVDFPPYTSEQLVKVLTDMGLSAKFANDSSKMAFGSVTKARELIEKEDEINSVFDWIRLLSGNKYVLYYKGIKKSTVYQASVVVSDWLRKLRIYKSYGFDFGLSYYGFENISYRIIDALISIFESNVPPNLKFLCLGQLLED